MKTENNDSETSKQKIIQIIYTITFILVEYYNINYNASMIIGRSQKTAYSILIYFPVISKSL